MGTCRAVTAPETQLGTFYSPAAVFGLLEERGLALSTGTHSFTPERWNVQPVPCWSKAGAKRTSVLPMAPATHTSSKLAVTCLTQPSALPCPGSPGLSSFPSKARSARSRSPASCPGLQGLSTELPPNRPSVPCWGHHAPAHLLPTCSISTMGNSRGMMIYIQITKTGYPGTSKRAHPIFFKCYDLNCWTAAP